MKNILLAGVSAAAFVLAGAAAQAADLPDFQEPVIAPVIAPVFSFAGFYVGANVGYINAEIERADRTEGIVFNNGAGTFFDDDDDGRDGVIAGVQAGFNAQFNQFVLGVEGDISGTFFDDENDDDVFDVNNAFTGFVNTPFGARAIDVDIDYLATLRARAGFAFDRFMIYGTGGFAFTTFDTDVRNPFGGTQAGAQVSFDDDDDIETGYTIGGGVEGLITENLTAKLEYLYVDFEDSNLDFRFTPAQAGAVAAVRNAEVDLDAHVVRVGVNFKFGGLGGF